MKGNQQTTANGVAVIILAAGLGKRMRSPKAKVLQLLNGRPMVVHVVETARSITENQIILVIGKQAEEVRQIVGRQFEGICFALQKEQLGTGHATMCALPQLPKHIKHVMILCGDVPLLTEETLARLLQNHILADRDMTLLAVEADNPYGYGRILTDQNNQMIGIVEEADATVAQRVIKIINSGIYCVKKEFLIDSLKQIEPNNIQGELYLTDIIAIGHRQGARLGFVMGKSFEEVVGVNTPDDLMRTEAILQRQFDERC